MKKSLFDAAKPIWLVTGSLVVAILGGPQSAYSPIRGSGGTTAMCVSHTENLVCRDLQGCSGKRYVACKDVDGFPKIILCDDNKLNQPCFAGLIDCSSHKDAATSPTCGE